MLNKNLFTSNSQEWETPTDLFNDLNQKYNFTLDACASDKNHKLKKYYTKENSCLTKNWKNERVFINPPYKDSKKFIKKCFEEKKTTQK